MDCDQPSVSKKWCMNHLYQRTQFLSRFYTLHQQKMEQMIIDSFVPEDYIMTNYNQGLDVYLSWNIMNRWEHWIVYSLESMDACDLELFCKYIPHKGTLLERYKAFQLEI
jgi:hypothetical protein